MGLPTRRTHVYAIVVFIISLASPTGPVGAWELFGQLVGSYLWVMLAQWLYRHGRRLTGRAVARVTE